MSDIEKLAAIAEINNLKARYYWNLDTKNWDGLKGCLSKSFVADFREAAGERREELYFEGGDKFVDSLLPVVGTAVTVHRAFLPEIEILSPTSARALWAFEDYVWPEEGKMPFKWIHGFGHSHDTYSVADGKWVIETLRLTRIRSEMG